MAVHIDDQALKDAARDMLALRQRNQRLKGKPSIMSTTNHKTPHCCRA